MGVRLLQAFSSSKRCDADHCNSSDAAVIGCSDVLMRFVHASGCKLLARVWLQQSNVRYILVAFMSMCYVDPHLIPKGNHPLSCDTDGHAYVE